MEKTKACHCGIANCSQCVQREINTLDDLRPGQSATVVCVEGEGALKRRIMDMGVTRGVSLLVKRIAPLGDPIEITVRGYQLSLRREDAARIHVV